MGQSENKGEHALPDTKSQDSATAISRLEQVNGHVSSSANRSNPRTKKARPAAAPADWSDVRSEFDKVRQLARTPKSDTTGYKRHKEAGKLWVRERVELLLDEGTFYEFGSTAGTARWRKALPDATDPADAEKEVIDDFTPSNNVQGFGKIQGRKVMLTADDFTLRAGYADGSLMMKTLYFEQLAIQLMIPVIKLVDGSSGGGSITTYKEQGGSYIPELELLPFVVRQLDMGIPNCAAVVGPAVGLGAARAAACHFSVMAADIGSLFNAGPPIVAGATFEEDLSMDELGGVAVHCSNGVIDNWAPNEKGCYDQIARFLSYVPNHGGVLPPIITCPDPASRRCPELRSSIPRRLQRAYQVRPIITSVVDKDSFFEIGAGWGKTAVVGLARIDGHPVGVFADDPEVNAGALDSGGCQKLSKHLKLCDVVGIPMIQFVDIPGFAIGTVAERSGVMKWAMELCKTYFTTTIPIFSAIIRRCYGIGGVILIDNREPNFRVAWPSLNSGSIPLDGGIEVNHRAELKRAGDKKTEVYKKLYGMYTNLQHPLRVANKFGIEEVIDPADTRILIAEWTKMMYEQNLPLRLQQRMAGHIKPSFR